MTTTKVNLANTVEGTLPVANGGTGSTTTAGAANAILPSQTGNTGKYLTTNGTDTSWGTVTSNPGTVTSVGGTGTVNGITLTGTVTSSGNLTLGGALSGVSLTTQVTGTLPVANGGTGSTSLTANRVLLGNGTSGLQEVAPGSNGNFLRSNGTTWVSQTVAVGSGTVTSVATGNGLSGGTITTSGTLTVACPSYNSVGSYIFASNSGNPTAFTAGTNYAAGTGNNNIHSFGFTNGVDQYRNNELSGTWKWMATTLPNGYGPIGIACRVS